MANLDVSELLNDPDFSDDLTIVRTADVVASNGETVRTTQSYFSWGVVGPATGQQLLLLPDEQRTADSIRVITPFQLQPTTDTTEPDLVAWQGRYYRVTILNEYSNWGDGFSDATCTLTTFTLPTPDQPLPNTVE